MRRGRRGKSPVTFPRTTPRPKDAHAASPDGRRKARRRGRSRRFSVACHAPSPARPRRRGQAVRPVDRRRRRSAIGQCAVSVSISGLSCLSTSAAPPPPSSSPLPPACPRLVSRAFGAPTGVPFGDDSARGGNKELRRWKTRGEGGLLPPLRGHCRVVAQRCRRWGASATPARAAVGVWYRGSFLPARQRSLQSRPASREGDNSSPFARAPVGNYRPRSRRSAASRYDKKARPSLAAPPAPLCSFASQQPPPLDRCFFIVIRRQNSRRHRSTRLAPSPSRPLRSPLPYPPSAP